MNSVSLVIISLLWISVSLGFNHHKVHVLKNSSISCNSQICW